METTGAPASGNKGFTLIGISGIAAPAVYLASALIAFSQYPHAFSPVSNWLSDLGNPLDNPQGAIFYRLGCIATALILVAFYVGLLKLKVYPRRIKVLWTIGIAGGMFSSVSLIVTGIFPLGTATAVHSLWSSFIYMSMAVFEAFSATVLIRNWRSVRWIGYYGIAATVINFVTGVFLTSVYAGEWAAVGTFILYVLFIASAVLERKRYP